MNELATGQEIAFTRLIQKLTVLFGENAAHSVPSEYAIESPTRRAKEARDGRGLHGVFFGPARGTWMPPPDP